MKVKVVKAQVSQQHACRSGSPLSHLMLLMYSDTAAGQNRNRSVLMMYMQVVSFSNITDIEHKFMDSGYSQTEVDSVHARTEQRT